MQIVNVIIIGLLVIPTSPTASVLADKLPAPRKAENTMPPIVGISVKSVTLMAREENRPPLGVPRNSNRDIGFASVFLRIENTGEKNANLVIQKIEIRNASDGKIQKFSQSPQEIRLHPLENSENAFYLTNKTGYSGQDKVKAVVTLKIGFQVSVIESEPVAVERH